MMFYLLPFNLWYGTSPEIWFNSVLRFLVVGNRELLETESE